MFGFGSFDHSEIPLEEEQIAVIIIGSSMVGMFEGLVLWISWVSLLGLFPLFFSLHNWSDTRATVFNRDRLIVIPLQQYIHERLCFCFVLLESYVN